MIPLMDKSNLPLTWRPALDGLRGIAVVCVVLFHFKTKPFLPGGSLGVDLFFALSGFLITSLLVEEWLVTGTVSLRRFYLRRFLRLFPALFAFIAVVAGVHMVFRDATFTGQPSVIDTLENVVYGLAYVYSWAIAFDSVRSFGFGHLWTLSIEEQYYVVWPALLLVMLRVGLPLRAVVAVTGLLALLSASVPWILGDATWRRLYYGADYRAHGLLIGSMAGMLYAGGFVRRDHVRHALVFIALAVSVVYLAGIMLFSSDKAVFLFAFGYPAVAAASSLIVVSFAFIESGWPLRLFGNRAITYMGRRSYAVYLWHMPVGQWCRSLDTAEHLVVAGAITLLAAELSHRLIEGPALSLKRRYERHSIARMDPVAIEGYRPAGAAARRAVA
jgi:peptidoglycan/LPS O-acetylase OafA/YrhL